MLAPGRQALAGVLPALALAMVFGGPDGARAQACDDVAKPGSRPDRFVRTLRTGEVGCFRSGRTYESSRQPIKLTRPGVTLTSTPGGARAKLVGRLWVTRRAHHTTVDRLKLVGLSRSKLPSPTVNGNIARFSRNLVTNDHQGICFALGNTDYGVARGIEIVGNRIHDCGKLPPTNRHHGIYVARTRGIAIKNNVIYGNADRGIQLYPEADGTVITGNVIDGNGEGVHFGGGENDASSNTLVARNLITYSRVRHNVEAHWQGPTGSRNLVTRNCVWAAPSSPQGWPPRSGIQESPKGFRAFANRVAEPRYVSREDGNYRLRPGSGCRGL